MNKYINKTIPHSNLILTLLDLFLIAMFRLLPERVFGNPDKMVPDMSEKMLSFWNSNQMNLPTNLKSIATAWRNWHLLKVGISICILIISSLLVISLWKSHKRSARKTTVYTATVLMFFIIFTLVVIGVNIQTSSAPIISLLMMLEKSVSTQMRNQLLSPQHAHTLEYFEMANNRYNWTLLIYSLVIIIISLSLLRFLRQMNLKQRYSFKFNYNTLLTVIIVTISVFILIIFVSIAPLINPPKSIHNLLS